MVWRVNPVFQNEEAPNEVAVVVVPIAIALDDLANNGTVEPKILTFQCSKTIVKVVLLEPLSQRH